MRGKPGWYVRPSAKELSQPTPLCTAVMKQLGQLVLLSSTAHFGCCGTDQPRGTGKPRLGFGWDCNLVAGGSQRCKQRAAT